MSVIAVGVVLMLATWAIKPQLFRRRPETRQAEAMPARAVKR